MEIFIHDFPENFMPAKRYKVTLSQEERTYLLNWTKKGQTAAQKLTKAADYSEKQSEHLEQEMSDILHVSMCHPRASSQNVCRRGSGCGLEPQETFALWLPKV